MQQRIVDNDPRSHFPRKPNANPASVLAGEKYRITVLTEGLIRYEYADDGVFEDRASTFAINRDLPTPKFKVVDSKDELNVTTDYFFLSYDKKPFSPSGFSVQVKGHITDWKSKWQYGGGIKEEQYYLYGTARTLDEADGRIPLEHGVINRNGYANLDDSKSFLFTDDGWITGRRPGDRVDGYLFAYGLDYKAALKAFYAVSGHQPLLPRWSLGNWWSRYYPYSDKEYLELLDRFAKENLPFSVAVLDMDWHLPPGHPIVEKSGFSGWTGYTWDKDLFPDPKKFLVELHKRGLKTCPNDHPADGVAPYEDMYEAMCHALGGDPKDQIPIPFDIANKQFNAAYFDVLLKAREDEGIDFWWIDYQQAPYTSVPGVDPLWVLNHFHFLNNMRGNSRPITFSRYAGPGSHRYPVGFSGDTVVTWESLDFQPEFTATSSNIGYGNWSHDIGGHMFGYKDDELAARWVQLGCFSPLLRLHSSNNFWNSKEPWRFVPESRTVMDETLRLRHQLMPYIYTMNVLSARDEPIVQPIYWTYPSRKEAYVNKNTYMFGTSLFIAPMTSPRNKVTRRSVTKAWLPPGRHVDIFTGLVYDGDRTISFHRKLDSFAVLAKQGSIIPFDAEKAPQNGCPNPKSFDIKVVVGEDGSFDMYEDNDSGADLSHANIFTTPMRYVQSKGTLSIGPISGTDESIPENRSWTITFLSLDQNLAENENISINIDGEKKNDTKLQKSEKSISVSVDDVSVRSKIEIVIGEAKGADGAKGAATDEATQGPQLSKNDYLRSTHEIIDESQSDFDNKNSIWAVLENKQKRTLSEVVSLLMGLDVDEEVRECVLEVVLADKRVWS